MEGSWGWCHLKGGLDWTSKMAHHMADDSGFGQKLSQGGQPP